MMKITDRFSTIIGCNMHLKKVGEHIDAKEEKQNKDDDIE